MNESVQLVLFVLDEQRFALALQILVKKPVTRDRSVGL